MGITISTPEIRGRWSQLFLSVLFFFLFMKRSLDRFILTAQLFMYEYPSGKQFGLVRRKAVYYSGSLRVRVSCQQTAKTSL
jgi:hypothetical protein